MISEIAGLVSNVVKDSVKLDENTTNAAATLVGKYKSIASMAKRSIMEYPVIISNNMADDTSAALKIVKQTELTYALFFALAAGLNPTVQADNTIGGHLGQFGGEGLKFTFKSSSEEDKNFVANSYNSLKERSSETYKKASDYLKENQSQEASGFFGVRQGRGWSSILPAPKPPVTNQRDINAGKNGGRVLLPEYVNGDERKVLVGNNPLDESIVKGNSDLFKKSIGKKLPTTFTINLYAGTHIIPVTIAVKAIPHFISQEEIDGLFSSLLEDNRRFFRFLQLTTGEISFFRDFILQLDRTARDKRLYAKLGTHPIYRDLMKRKNWSETTTLAKMNEKTRGLLKGQPDALPNITMVVTMDEVSKALKLTTRKIIDNPKEIQKVMTQLMLLGFVIYDQTSQLIYFYYSSFSRPHIYHLKDLKSDKENIDDAMVELIRMMQGMIR